jgi:hypothetical protein
MSLRDLVVVTGMSGSGKGTVLKIFEDLGFFCIDNLPVTLIPKLVEGINVSGGEVKHAALVIDIRAGGVFMASRNHSRTRSPHSIFCIVPEARRKFWCGVSANRAARTTFGGPPFEPSDGASVAQVA